MSEQKPKSNGRNSCPPDIKPCELAFNQNAVMSSKKKTKAREVKPFDEMTYEERCEEHKLAEAERKFAKKCPELVVKKEEPKKKRPWEQ